MSLENESMKSIYEEKQAFENMADSVEDPEVETTAGGGLKIDFSFLLAKTGDGSIESYIDHPLNFSRSKGLGQILRGATGLVGELDLAIVDIGIGAFNIMREGKKVNEFDYPGQ